ncbi:GDP-mannose transporter GONST2 [Amborella trichopoda]|uniref:GDP-mannose transporter GONST2 n=1 Tax=Amborella trichopoda TaxID=13333 RepID=UPI0005D4447F|nr:GDP-mannose transporter GONST2 [Amborella trichopoda]XP_020525330.1 GDP-mannose transporter GONST2 [Amborella trichopoda]XP_020525331.1 GDP-mannose transporter GONST2 [Amborella trichopoda]|eukprot:XP_011624830.1 GDP-mannose transporter GONST2 [Amborella trichopoda]
MTLNGASDPIADQDIEKADLSDMNGAVTNGERDNIVCKIIHNFLKQGPFINLPTNIARRATAYRSLTKTHAGPSDIDLENDGVENETEKGHRGSERKSKAFISGAAYCLSSCSMILLNKVVLSSYGFNAGVSLMFYQNLVSVLVVIALSFTGLVSTEKITWKLIRVWTPVNIIFVGMLVTGMYSLKYINIAMVTILKNVTNILTAIGEIYMFRKHQNAKVWAALVLMIISAISGGITDLTFDGMGYAWQALNCILTASYALTLRRIMDIAKQTTKSGTLNEVSMVLLNNSLSLPFALFLIILSREWEYVFGLDVISTPVFWVVTTASGLLGLAISFTSIWFLNQTGPTTYSLVGSLNKIPISIAGILLFKVPLSTPNLFSILFGLFAGVLFAKAKMS